MYSVKNVVRVGVCFALCVLWVTNAQAAIFTTDEAQVQVKSLIGSPPPSSDNPPVDNIIELGFGEGGRVYTNSVAIDLGTGFATDLRTVTVNTLDNASSAFNQDFDSLRFMDANGDPHRVLAIAAIRGFVFEENNARFTEGKLWFYALDAAGNINADDPTTWGPGLLTLITSYTLKEEVTGERDSLAPGPDGEQVSPLPAYQIDVSGVNSAIGAAGQGNFIWLEDDNDPFIDIEYIDGDGNAHNSIASSEFQDEEGVYTLTSQTVLDYELDDPIDAGGALWGLAQLAVLDGYATAGFGGPFATADAPFGDWNPLNSPGDFKGSLSSEMSPGGQVVPEPASVAIWSLLLIGAAGLCARRRRRGK